jgi:hypothetical protein
MMPAYGARDLFDPDQDLPRRCQQPYLALLDFPIYSQSVRDSD